MNIDLLDMEESTGCSGDHVLIYDGRDSGSNLLARICGKREVCILTTINSYNIHSCPYFFVFYCLCNYPYFSTDLIIIFAINNLCFSLRSCKFVKDGFKSGAYITTHNSQQIASCPLNWADNSKK